MTLDGLSDEKLLDDLGRRSVRSGAVRVGGQAIQVVLAVGGGAILARLLLPADFGVFAMALTLIGFVMWIRDFGLPMAATQRETLEHGPASAVFRVSVGLSLLMTIFIVSMGPALAWFYDEPRLVAVVAALSVATLIGGFSIVPEGLMIRGMRFGSLAAIEIGAAVASFATGVTIALLGGGYWALVGQHVALVSVRGIAIFVACRWRPTLRVAPEHAKQARGMLRYGGQLTLTRVLRYFGQNTDRILVGYFHGQQSLGLYDNSFRWSRYPVHQVFGPLRNVFVSALSRLQGDRPRYRAAFVRAGLPVYTVSIPALAYLVVDTPHVILAVLGEQWLEAIPLFRFLAASGIATTMRASTIWSYLSEGRTDRQLRWEIFASPAMILAIVIGLQWGVLGVAVAYAAGAWLLVLPGAWFCARGSALALGDFFIAWWRPVAASLTAAAALFAVSPDLVRATPPGTGELAALGAMLLRGAGFSAVYALVWVALPGGRARLGDLRLILRELRPAPSGGQIGEGPGV